MGGYSWLVYLAAFWLTLYLLSHTLKIGGRGGNVRIGPGYLMVKSSRMNNLFVGLVSRYRSPLNLIYKIGMYLGLGFIAIIIVLLVYNLVVYFTVSPGSPPPAKLLIPGVTIGVDREIYNQIIYQEDYDDCYKP
jgi:hypothetical protein